MKYGFVSLLFLLAAAPLSAFATDAGVTSEVVGSVVTVKRNFTIDLNRCLEVAMVNINGFSGNYNCSMELMPEQQGEVVVTGPSNPSYRNVMLDDGTAVNLSLSAGATGYSIMGYWSASKLMNLKDLRPQLEQMLREIAPNGSITVLVHTTKFFKN